jgi:hypothetical protein
MDYVSPIDERVLEPEPLATRPATLQGARVALLDIGKARGDEFLDALEALLHREGATTRRFAKPLFSRPAAQEVIEQVALHGDLAIEALAD